MTSINVPHRLLEAFLLLAHHKNFTVAAAEANLSQPAFSQAISRLEAQAGVRLFDRNTRYVSLTPEGKILLPVAQRLTQDIADVFQQLRDLASGITGTVTIATIPSSAARWLPRIIRE